MCPALKEPVAVLRTLLAALGSLVFAASQTAAQPPSVGFAHPAAVTPGKSTDVTFYGANLAGASSAWSDVGATIELSPDVESNGTKPDQVVFRITVPEETSLQIGAARLVTSTGISNLRLLMVDDLPSVADNGANKTIESAQELTLPVAVDGSCEPESFDFYKFNAFAGQRISVEVFARRLGFPLDPVIRLLDEAGKELAYSDDEGGTSADSRFAYQFDADGMYYIEIRDIRYQGGGAHRYRLRIGDFPLLNTPMPMAARRGSLAKLTAAGPDVARADELSIEIPERVAGDVLPVTFHNREGQGGAFSHVITSQTNEQVEFEPNETPEQASPIVVPGAVNGRFAVEKDRDFYQFDVEAGQRYLFIGHTRRASSPADLFMRLYKVDGTQLAEVDDAGLEEGILNHTFAEAGSYRLMVEDLHRRGGSDLTYRVEVVPYQPGFQLAVAADTVNAPRGGVFVVKVTSRRFDYNGPITLLLENAEGFSLANNVIAEGQNEVEMRVAVSGDLEPGHWRNLEIVGTATINDLAYRAHAGTLDALKGQFAGLPFPPATLEGIVGLGIGPVFPEFFKLSVDDKIVRLPQLIGTTNLVVKSEKLNGFSDAVALAVEGLPAEFVAEVKPIEKDQDESHIVLKGPPTAAEGEHRFRIVGSAVYQDQPQAKVIDELVLRVVPPLEIRLTFEGPVVAGQVVKAHIRATRFGEEQTPIAVKFQGLPIGLSAPGELVISADESEIDVELGTAPNSMIGTVQHVTLTGSTTVKGRDIRVESGPASLEVTMSQ